MTMPSGAFCTIFRKASSGALCFWAGSGGVGTNVLGRRVYTEGTRITRGTRVEGPSDDLVCGRSPTDDDLVCGRLRRRAGGPGRAWRCAGELRVHMSNAAHAKLIGR